MRDFGFDLDGVPDSEAERRAAGRDLGALEGQVPSFVMYGRRD